jgi:hypothetical protein
MTRYIVELNEAEEGGSQTIDILTLEGTKKQKRKQWKSYLQVRAGVIDVHECNRIAKAMGFKELVK